MSSTNTSRYGNARATEMNAVTELEPKDIPKMMDELRTTFATDRTRSKSWRLSQLRAFLCMIEEEGAELCDALLKDLHKSPLEGLHIILINLTAESNTTMVLS